MNPCRQDIASNIHGCNGKSVWPCIIDIFITTMFVGGSFLGYCKVGRLFRKKNPAGSLHTGLQPSGRLATRSPSWPSERFGPNLTPSVGGHKIPLKGSLRYRQSLCLGMKSIARKSAGFLPKKRPRIPGIGWNDAIRTFFQAVSAEPTNHHVLLLKSFIAIGNIWKPWASWNVTTDL